MQILLIGLGGFLGALARHGVDSWVRSWVQHPIPFGIMAVNVTGSFAVGLVFGLLAENTAISPEFRAPLMVGFLGAYTTFSTLAIDTWRLAEEGAFGHAAANLLGSVLLGLVAVVIGLVVGRSLT